MKLTELLHSSNPTLSCELFPPKPGTALLDAPTLVRRMAALHPSYMSVTCSAGGSGNGGASTADMANEVQNINGIPALAHLTCVSADRAQIRAALEDLRKLAEENGMVNLWDSGKSLVLKGITDVSELMTLFDD